VVDNEEEEGEMGNQGMNGHDSSSEKHGVEDNQEGEGMIDLHCWHVFAFLSVVSAFLCTLNVVASTLGP
jgi:hypothetical protein